MTKLRLGQINTSDIESSVFASANALNTVQSNLTANIYNTYTSLSANIDSVQANVYALTLDTVAINGNVTTASIEVAGLLSSGDLTVSGNVIAGNILPLLDDTYSLGSNVYRWKDVFLGPGTINIQDTANANLVAELTVENGVLQINGADQLQAKDVVADSYQFNTSADVTVTQGQMAWNSSDGTVDIGIGYGGVVLQVGQETHYIVRNSSGDQIENGTAVYCNGVTEGSGRKTVLPMVGDGSISPVDFLGLATMDINNGVNGVVTYFGYVRDLDTRGTANTSISVGDETWAIGDKLYVHPTAEGKLTNIEPEAPNTKICVASIITRHQTVGVLFVRPTTNLVLDRLSDVQVSVKSDGDVLTYVSGNARWEPKSVSADESNLYNTYTTVTGLIDTVQDNVTSLTSTIDSIDANTYNTYTTLTANIYNTYQNLASVSLYAEKFTVDGSTNSFTLSNSVSSEESILVYIDGIVQHSDAYIVNDTNLTIANTLPLPSSTLGIRRLSGGGGTTNGSSSGGLSYLRTYALG
jgi:hypothetical protein